MKLTPGQLLRALVLAVVLAAVGCTTTDAPPVETSTAESALVCTPGDETCDWGCGWVGGPSTNDCIVRCNSTGTAWIKVQDCGWAQNFPYSSSCLDSRPHPVCQNN